VLRRIFGPNRDKVAGGWMRLHNEELHNLHASQNVTRMIWMGLIACMGEIEKCIQNFCQKT
jgi:hypothetical protein